jgi:uncharacterized protein (TIGR02147 family)
MNIYEFSNYKVYFNKWISRQPRGGHGEYRRLAQSLDVSTTMVSQVFKGEKNLSLELACEVSAYLNHSIDETDYFLLMVEHARAGSFKLRQSLERQIKKRQLEAQKIENLMKKDMELDEEAKSVFYSSWYYSGIRLLTDIEQVESARTIAERLRLPQNLVQKVIDFLVEKKLCIRDNGNLKMGPARTHIGASSILSARHHQNWRLYGISKMGTPSAEDLFFTAPMSLSKEVANKIREHLPTVIKEMTDLVGPSKSETVRCLNIDWFEF